MSTPVVISIFSLAHGIFRFDLYLLRGILIVPFLQQVKVKTRLYKSLKGRIRMLTSRSRHVPHFDDSYEYEVPVLVKDKAKDKRR